MSGLNINEFIWTPEAHADLHRLCAQLLSAREIAAALSVAYNHEFSRNAILGKIHRLGITNKNSSKSPRKRAPWAAPVEKKTREWHAVIKFAPPISEPVQFLSLEPHHCRFVLGETNGADTFYCGADKAIGCSFCEYHQAKCFGKSKSIDMIQYQQLARNARQQKRKQARKTIAEAA